jgi:o-succinylbenzoate---CoA ligase
MTMHLFNRLNHDRAWIHGTSNDLIKSLAADYGRSIAAFPPGSSIFLAERDPVHFLAAWITASSANCRLFLCNPAWQEHEWQQLYALIQPDLVLGRIPDGHTDRPHPPNLPEQAILIPTGGTSGKLKFAIHNWNTLSAAVQGFRAHFQLDVINSVCVLPLYHVSGLMQAMRSLLTGGTIVITSSKNLIDGILPDITPNDFFISLVPTQLSRLLPDQVDVLRGFQAILLGGAPAWESLLIQARSAQLPIAPTYGMTETAGQIATLHPKDFLAGQTGCGSVLPHASITIDANSTLTIAAESMMLGYFPAGDQFQADDVGYFDAARSLHITGRHSSKIITGGENVFPVELEGLLWASGLVQDVTVVGIPDADWGEAIVVVYVPHDAQILPKTALQSLAHYKQPKHWISLTRLPRNAQGKISRDRLVQLILDRIYYNM